MANKYSVDLTKLNENAIAKARAEDIDMSYRDATNVCDAIRGKSAKEALIILEQVFKENVPIRFRKHNKHLGHRAELGGKKGRYPKKISKIIYKVVKSAMANAMKKGLDEESLIVVHASSNKKRTYPRMAPVGRTSRSYYETARVEIILLDTSFDEAKAMKIKEIKKKEKEISEAAKKIAQEAATQIKEKTEEPLKEEISEDKSEKIEKVEKKNQKDNKKKDDNNGVNAQKTKKE